MKALTVVSLLKSKAASTSHSRTHSIALARASSVMTASSLSPPGKKGGEGMEGEMRGEGRERGRKEKKRKRKSEFSMVGEVGELLRVLAALEEHMGSQDP